jgi:hypothetical protein
MGFSAAEPHSEVVEGRGVLVDLVLMATKTSKKKPKAIAKAELLPPDPEFLKRFSDPSSELPSSRDPSLSLTVRVFERESELKGAFKKEFALQLDELHVCSVEDCSFRYVTSNDRDAVVRMLVHHYLHLVREAESRVQLGALNRISEILDPPKERVTQGLLESGLLTQEERKMLKLTKRDLADI